MGPAQDSGAVPGGGSWGSQQITTDTAKVLGSGSREAPSRLSQPWASGTPGLVAVSPISLPPLHGLLPVSPPLCPFSRGHLLVHVGPTWLIQDHKILNLVRKDPFPDQVPVIAVG